MKTKHFKIGLIFVAIGLLILGHFRACKIERSINDVKIQNKQTIDEIHAIGGHVAHEHVAGHVVAPYVRYLGNFTATFYCSCPKCVGNKSVIKTASGNRPITNKTIAVDTAIIPLHSIIYIPNMGYFVAEDTGGHIKGKRIDIFVNNHAEALKQGKKSAKVYILQTP